MQKQVANTSLGDIEFRIHGRGVPVLFVHGGHSNCEEVLCHRGFDPAYFQLITPSRPGYGATPLPGNRTPKQAADLFGALLEELAIDQVVVYGISAGGLTALELASRYPDKVRKLILASAISKKWLTEQDRTYQMASIIFSPRMERFTWGILRVFLKVFPRLIAQRFYSQFSSMPLRKLRADDVKVLIRTLARYRSKVGFVNDLDQDIPEDTLARIKCPTLILHSKYDNSVPFEHALHARARIKQATLLELNNEWGHLLWLGEDAAEAISRTAEFAAA